MSERRREREKERIEMKGGGHRGGINVIEKWRERCGSGSER